MPREFTLPDLGEGITEAQIIRVMIKQGENISEDQSLMEVETDKAAVEIPSPYAGIAQSVHVKEGQTVNVGEVIVTFDDTAGGNGAGAVATKPAAAKPESKPTAKAAAPVKPAPTAEAPEQATSQAPKKTTSPAAPAIRKLAREMGIDLDSISGSGPGGRITREDVEGFTSGKSGASAPAQRAPRKPAEPLPGVADSDKWGKTSKEPISQIRKTIAKQMARSAYTAVHVTHGDEANVSELDRMRRVMSGATGNDPKITIMTFVIKACCIALRKYPIFNSSFDEEGGFIVYKDYINIGIAVDTPRGLIVPVLRNVDRLSIQEIAVQLRALAEQIRSNKFEIEDLRGGTFTITNVGALGGTFSTPIINYPEVAILGLGKTRNVPVVKDNQIVPGLVLPLNLSFDHKATDGANAARFTSDIINHLENPALFLID